METRRQFGQHLKLIRNEKGLTLLEVSKRLGYKSIGTINNVEQGLTPLPIDKIHPLCDAYEMELDHFLDLLRIYEPDLYKRYERLSMQILRHFTRKVTSLHNPSYGTTGEVKGKARFKTLPEYILYDYAFANGYFHLQRNKYFISLTKLPHRGYKTHFSVVDRINPQSANPVFAEKMPRQLKLDLRRRLPENVFRIRDKTILPSQDPGSENARVA